MYICGTKANNMNITLTSANGKTYQVSTNFKVGDKVAVHSVITGKLYYIGTIVSMKRKYAKVIVSDYEYTVNLSSSALVIN